MAGPGFQFFDLASGEVIGSAAYPSDGPVIADFLLEHGHIELNFLPPEDELRAYIEPGVRDGTVSAIVSRTAWGVLVGVVTYELSHRYADYQPDDRKHEVHGYISEGLVHRDFRGEPGVRKGWGIGTASLRAALTDLEERGAREIYTDRDAENISSGLSLHRAGFVDIGTFADPKKRTEGSGFTTLARFTSG